MLREKAFICPEILQIFYMSPEVFISYSRNDQEKVCRVAEKLKAHGLKIWIDHQGIEGATRWSEEIVTALEGAKVMVFFASAHAFASKNVARELALASESDKNILPVFLEQVNIPDSMKYQLAGIQHLDASQDSVDELASRIVQSLANLQVGRHEPASAPEAHSSRHLPKEEKVEHNRSKILSLLAGLALVGRIWWMMGRSAHVPGNASSSPEVALNKVVVVTQYEDEERRAVSDQNRELRESVMSKLGKFRDISVILGDALSPDASTDSFAALTKEKQAAFVLHVSHGSASEKIRAKAFESKQKTFFWSLEFPSEDQPDTEKLSLEECTSIISANLAGYDGVIHQWTYRDAEVLPVKHWQVEHFVAMAKQIWEFKGDMATATETALSHIQKAIELQPGHSTAHAIKSQIYGNAHTVKLATYTNALEVAKAASIKAVELDDRNGIAHLARLWVSMHERDFFLSEQLVNRADDINANEPFLLATIGFYHVFSDNVDLEAGRTAVEKAIRYNRHPQNRYFKVLEEYHAQKKEYKKALELAMRKPEGSFMVSVYYWILDEKALALKKLKEYLSTRPTEANMLETITAQDEDNLYLSKNPLLIEARQALLSAYQAQEKDGGQP